MSTRSGLTSLIGRPNVGKSTLLNALMGKKISITSHKPQTTRQNLYGIITQDDSQMVFIDTPGLHRLEPRKLNQWMNKQARSTLEDIDIILFMIEAGNWTPEDDHVLKLLRPDQRVILIINKIDCFKEKEELLPFMQEVSQKFAFDSVIPLSAFCKDNIDVLKNKILSTLPEGPFYFPEDMICSRETPFQISELIREKIMRELEKEVPYATTVQIEKMSQRPTCKEIHALIWVEREGQKRILIGAKGETLKAIGTHARRDIERLIGEKVLLKLWVKVKKGWADDARALAELGFTA